MKKELIFDEDLQDFVETRLSHEYKNFGLTKKIKEDVNEYNMLFDRLSDDEKNKIDRLIILKDNISNYESTLAYCLGINDSFKILNI